MFSRMKMKEFMESELSGIFLVKVVAKNTVFGSPGTHLMRMRVKIDLSVVLGVGQNTLLVCYLTTLLYIYIYIYIERERER